MISQRVQTMTYVTHKFSYSCNIPACSIFRIFPHRLYGRKLICCQFEERRKDVMTFHRRVKKATGHVKVVVARELQISRRDQSGCWLGHQTRRYCRQNFTLAAINTGIESLPSIKTKRTLNRPTLPEITIHTNTIVSNSLCFGRSRDRIPVWVRFSAPVQTGTGVHPAACTMGTGSLFRG